MMVKLGQKVISPQCRYLGSSSPGKNTFVALRTDGTAKYAYSTDGINWTDQDFPYRFWGGIVFGGGYMVFDNNSNNVLWSENGIVGHKAL